MTLYEIRVNGLLHHVADRLCVHLEWAGKLRNNGHVFETAVTG